MTKYRICALVLSLVIVASAFIFNTPATTVLASSEIKEAKESDFIYSLLPKDNPTTAFIELYLGSDTKIILPETIEGLPVVNISSGVFSENEDIEYIKIPSSVETISSIMFNLCSSLTEIDVADDNPYYTSVDGVVYNKDQTTLVAFPCGKGGSFRIPDSVISIGPKAFESCYNLTEVTMGNNVLTIGNQAFLECWNLSSITLSNNLQKLGYRALGYCDSLTEIHLPASLKTIGGQAVIGGMDSDSNWYYNFTDGIYYVPGTPSEEYVKTLHVPKEYTIAEYRSFKNEITDITLLDPNNTLPTTGVVEFKAITLNAEDYTSLIPVKYSSAYAYKLEILVDGKPYTPKKDVVVQFGNTITNHISTATKVYEYNNNELTECYREPYAPFVGLQTTALGTYVVASGNDFSLRGDIDGDGVVSAYDTRMALCVAAKLIPVNELTDEQYIAADVDTSTLGITTADAKKILRIAAGLDK